MTGYSDSSDDERKGFLEGLCDGNQRSTRSAGSERSNGCSGRAVGQSTRLLQRKVQDTSRSQGMFDVDHTGSMSKLEQLGRSNVFHVLANMPLRWLVPIYCLVYICFWLAFAGLWLSIAKYCDEDLVDFRRAYLLSMETMMTIGYGVPDPYFRDCEHVVPLLTTQCLITLLLDAAFLNLLYTRLSCAFSRSASLIFSRTSVINDAKGSIHWTFRLCEIEKRPLIEPIVRLYAIKHVEVPEDSEGIDVQVLQLGVSEPDCSIADGKLFLSLPAVVSHCIDADSPLAPDSGKDLTVDDVYKYFMGLHHLEILAILSGTCPVTGNMLETRHSYVLQEILWDRTFAKCVSLASGRHSIDWSAFHDTLPVFKEEKCW
eukprot:TRINITY_DN20679_c0_g1_i1.p1 TRINITY_DN20679_c0_g1~~TRINITY_DN20679_c0_g1_i1.p1  ORF type:complete len:372 (+),score=36.03 TRINITY_DN20679_c0_g1_i1:131-1246(+)